MKYSSPLKWPPLKPRTRWRVAGKFKVGFEETLVELSAEVERIDGHNLSINSNASIGRFGLVSEPSDPGVVVSFERNGKVHTFCCDTYTTVYGNIRGVVLTLIMIRGIKRHGATEMFETALSAFA